VLPIVVSADDREALMADASDTENPELSVDLVAQTIRRPNGVTVSFDIDPFRKTCLLEGLDDIGLTMEKGADIDSFEAKRASAQPWL
jgi:3-isopropylmalate/(R)-2-methylmalate dehydratase small subunit